MTLCVRSVFQGGESIGATRIGSHRNQNLSQKKNIHRFFLKIPAILQTQACFDLNRPLVHSPSDVKHQQEHPEQHLRKPIVLVGSACRIIELRMEFVRFVAIYCY